jgi:hypothetical protein
VCIVGPSSSPVLLLVCNASLVRASVRDQSFLVALFGVYSLLALLECLAGRIWVITLVCRYSVFVGAFLLSTTRLSVPGEGSCCALLFRI